MDRGNIALDCLTLTRYKINEAQNLLKLNAEQFDFETKIDSSKMHLFVRNAFPQNLNGRQPQWKTTSMEDNLNGRELQWKMISMEDGLNGRQPQPKTTSMEDDLDRRQI